MVQIIRSLINLRHNRLSVRLMFKILIVTQIMLAPSSIRAQPINSCVCKVLENAEPGFNSELLQSAGDEKPQAKKKKTKSKKKKASHSETDAAPDHKKSEEPSETEKSSNSQGKGTPQDNPEKGSDVPRQYGWNREALDQYINRQPAERRPKYFALANSKDQSRLLQTALTDNDPVARQVATRSLKDEKSLMKVALESSDWLVRPAAADQIIGEDQEALMKLIESSNDRDVKSRLIGKVRDPAKRLAFQDAQDGIKKALREREQRKQEEASDRLLLDKDPAVSERALQIKQNNDPNQLLKIALDEPQDLLADLATKQLLDLFRNRTVSRKAFETIALRAKSYRARRLAVPIVTDNDVLKKASNDPHPDVQAAAMKKIELLRGMKKSF